MMNYSMNRILQIAVFSLASLSVLAFAADEDKAAAATEAEPEPAVVVTNEGLVEKCILPLVVTEVDGKAVEKDTGRYELAAGSHAFSGYAEGDFMGCTTMDNARLSAGGRVGDGSTITVDVPAGKEYFLGLDVRKDDPKTWKIVTWRINH